MTVIKTRAVAEKNRELAYYLYMKNMPMREIAERVGVKERTLFSWVDKYAWREKRAVQSVTKASIKQKLYQQIDKLLTEAEGEVNADKLAKLSKTLQSIEGGYSAQDMMEIFFNFIEWCKKKARTDKHISEDFIKKVIQLQDEFLSEHIKQ